ncbi:aminotransferase class I/II-fold pyridoxal phosphate-dependent enzyme [soil metagenome]
MRKAADYISARAHAVDASGIRKVFDLAAKMKAPINLSIGQPDFEVPPAVQDAAVEAIRRGENKYTQTQGIAPLRERLRSDLAKEFNRKINEVMITSGVEGGLYLAMLAILDPGDEVIFLDPYFVGYKHVVTMAGGTPVPVDSYPDFRFRAERVEKLITKKTKMMILSSPANPTGAVLSDADLRDAVALAAQHDLLILSDEIYKAFVYDKQKPDHVYSPGSLYEKTIVLRGFSKSHAMTGWRIGYAIAPDAILQQMLKLQQHSYICAPAPFQWAALAALDVSMADQLAAYRRKRDLVVEKLSKKFELTAPGGAFYCFPKAPNGLTATDFVTKAIESNVLVIPGNVFSEVDTHFRVSYAATDETLARGCETLCSLV